MSGARDRVPGPMDSAPTGPVLRRARGVGIVEEDGVVYLGRLPGGPLLVLSGSAGAVWQAAQGVRRDEAAGRVADALGLEEADVAASVEDFVDELLAQGLLESC